MREQIKLGKHLLKIKYNVQLKCMALSPNGYQLTYLQKGHQKISRLPLRNTGCSKQTCDYK